MKENRKNMKKENYVKVAIPKGKVAKWNDQGLLQLLLPANDLFCGRSFPDSIWSDITDADSSSVRLALKSETLASYCGKQFATLWAEHYTGKICKPWREVKKD